MRETIPLTFRIDANLKRQLDAEAAADFRSTASLLNSIVARHLAGSSSAPAVQLVAPEPAEVYYTRPRGRPRIQREQQGPNLAVFERWLETLTDDERDTITADRVVSDFLATNPSPEEHKLARAAVLLNSVGYVPLIAHYPDGSEAEVWRKTAK